MWADIEQAADVVWDRFPQLSREQRIAKAMERDPALFATYCEAQREAQWAHNQRVGHRREL